MKVPHVKLSDIDAKAVCCSLSVLPLYRIIEDEEELNFCINITDSIVLKISSNTPLTDREVSYLSLAIDCAYKALRGEITCDKDVPLKLAPYIFSINKLHPIFLPFLDE